MFCALSSILMIAHYASNLRFNHPHPCHPHLGCHAPVYHAHGVYAYECEVPVCLHQLDIGWYKYASTPHRSYLSVGRMQLKQPHTSALWILCWAYHPVAPVHPLHHVSVCMGHYIAHTRIYSHIVTHLNIVIVTVRIIVGSWSYPYRMMSPHHWRRGGERRHGRRHASHRRVHWMEAR